MTSESLTPFDYDSCDWKTLLTQGNSPEDLVRKKFHRIIPASVGYQRGAGTRQRPVSPFPPTVVPDSIEAPPIVEKLAQEVVPPPVVKEGFVRRKEGKKQRTKKAPHIATKSRAKRSYFLEALKK